MSLSIQKLKSEDINNLLKFNKMIYPQKKNLKQRFFWYFINNPLINEEKELNSLLCYSKEKDIIGQMLINPIEWSYNEKFKGYYGVDYFVLKKFRGVSGILLSLKSFKEYKPFFGFSPSPQALEINLSLKLNIIGSLDKYIWYRNPIAPLKIVAKKLIKYIQLNKDDFSFRKNIFPEVISNNKFEFVLKNKIDHWNDSQWKNTLVFTRSKEFIKWRFFDSYRKYYFYKMDENQTSVYFVVRRCYWKGLDLLVIVDYRVPYIDINGWESILLATKLLAKKINCDGVITMSSHHFFDEELRNKKFYKVGNEAFIVSNAKIEVTNKVIQEKNFIYATMADSDIDLDFGN